MTANALPVSRARAQGPDRARSRPDARFPDSVKWVLEVARLAGAHPLELGGPTATDQESRGEIVWNLYLGEAYPLEQASALAREIEEEPHG
jgi:hypothetical protein